MAHHSQSDRHCAEVSWLRGDQDFLSNRYSRRHLWRFDGGTEIVASSSPHVVPLPYSDAAAVDPEEAFVASLSSCHMLWYLSIAAQRGWCVERYVDNAVGTMSRDTDGRVWMASVVLHPEVRFSGARLPDVAENNAMHDAAHHACFIANSVKSEVRCEPVWVDA
ncbi:OsmC family protein [Chitinasiproducens palmae]|uniref:Organic hydroperoxide reductase OsmC/OhrA n=1 Tax=Chitinasiproducens palmae TaxID=1770053 RepID=A0A1H2PTB5_9BURK|nr:OsmC family protein [Chitinasiproducens palmae]SDV50344.1 Organic hydroperoxide reductase OsmC/OhrA [Chitinasiproducens palmae]